MGTTWSMTVAAVCLTVIFTGVAGVVLEQINQKLEVLELATIGRKRLKKHLPNFRMIGWAGSQLDDFKEIWMNKVELQGHVINRENPNDSLDTSTNCMESLEVRIYPKIYLKLTL